ncbi:MAG: hypothetical protein NT092_10500 [Bacteroidia bacterium]|nr:hypothetical protein [Bacteroidia bacterium]
MKRLSLTLFFLLSIFSGLFSQDFFWHSGLNSFFDNIEFAGSHVKVPQTMAGVMIAPEIEFEWDSVNRIVGGVNIMHEFGSSEIIDRIYSTAYYEYCSKPFTFIMGAFPRSLALEKYPRMFFQDSLSYYRPNINGIYFQYGKDQKYVNVWLDWTGRQSPNVREAFFVGLSGRYNLGIFYAQHFSYMFHYASRMNPLHYEPLHDNMLLLTSAGSDLSGRTFLDRLEGNVGWVLGLERSRSGNADWITMHGLQVEARAEYKFAGIHNTFYAGQGMMYFYKDHENDLYWGDPVYRAKVYDRADIYVKFLRKQNVNLELTWSLHFLEGNVYNEQMLKLRMDINKAGIFTKGKL